MYAFQNCWVVRSLPQAIQRCHEHYGVGPFFLNEHSKIDSMIDRGKSVSIDFSIAIAHVGEVQFEFVEVHADEPRLFREWVPAGQERLHHMGWIVPDYEKGLAQFRRRGVEVRCEGVMGDMRFAFADTRAEFGCMLEVFEENASLRNVLARVKEASVSWDRRELIRPFSSLF